MKYALMFLCLGGNTTCVITPDMARVSGVFAYASVADCVDEGKVMPISDAATLVCIDIDGRVVWDRQE